MSERQPRVIDGDHQSPDWRQLGDDLDPFSAFPRQAQRRNEPVLIAEVYATSSPALYLGERQAPIWPGSPIWGTYSGGLPECLVRNKHRSGDAWWRNVAGEHHDLRS
jgi:hypothetical protein